MFEDGREIIKEDIMFYILTILRTVFLTIPIIIACMTNIGYGHPYIWIACVIEGMLVIAGIIIGVIRIISKFKELEKLNEQEREHDEWLDEF